MTQKQIRELSDAFFPSTMFLWSWFLPSLASKEILFVEPAGNEVTVLVKGKDPYAFLLSPSSGFHVNNPNDEENFDNTHDDWEILPNVWFTRNGQQRTWIDTRSFLNKNFSTYGFPWPFAEVMHKHMVWRELSTETAGHRIVRPRSEMVRSLLLKDFAYYTVVHKVVTNGGELMDIPFTVVLRLTNPHTAWFKVDNWHDRGLFQIEQAVKNWAANQTPAELASETDNKGEKKLLLEHILKLNDAIPGRTDGKSFKQLVGHEIVDINLRSPVLSDDADGEKSKTLRQEWLAKQNALKKDIDTQAEAKAKRDLADAEAYSKRTVGDAEAYAVDKLKEAETKTPDRTRAKVAEELGKVTGTLVFDKGGINIMVPPSAPSAPPPPKPKPTTTT